MQKTCSRCGDTKPETIQFWTRNQWGKNGFRSQCKTCTNVTNRATCARNKHKWAPARRDYWLRKHYGITSALYDQMLEAQGGACRICYSKSPKRAKQVYFSVDHCHKTGVVRGLLCVNCNTLVGLLENIGPTKEIAARALTYLETSIV